MRQVRSHFKSRPLTGPASQAQGPRRGRRSAFTLVELIATLILLGVVFTVSISILGTSARQRRATEQRQFAIQHAANLLERTMMRTWSELPAGPQTLEPPPTDVEAVLPGLSRRVEVSDLPQDVATRLITVTVRWKDLSGRELAPVHLSAWMHSMEQASP